MNSHKLQGQAPKSAQAEDADKAALEAEPNWDRMGQIAKRLMATPPDKKVAVRQATIKKAHN